MAFVYKKSKGSRFYVGYRDELGRKRKLAVKAETKAEARRLAVDLEHRAERLRLGLEVAPVKMTFGELADYWLKNYCKPRHRSYKTSEERIRLHLRPTLGGLQLLQVTPRVLDELLGAKLKTHSAQTVVHLRGLVRKLFNDARRWGFWRGDNPATLVEPPKVVRKPPTYAPADDIPKLLAAAAEPFRTIDAIAIYGGLREGEILELRREEVDVERGLFIVTRTVGRETTKGGKFRPVPMPAELLPFVAAHLARTPGEFLFPAMRAQGKSAKTTILRQLRRDMCAAGLVLGYDHICRRRLCRFVERRTNAVQAACPKCGMQLWIRPIPKPLTFHALRHTYVSHLIMLGANPVSVQRLAGHADLKTTLDVYGHLAPDFMRGEVERLRFGIEAPQVAAPAPEIKAAAAGAEAVPPNGGLPGGYPPPEATKNEAGGALATARSDSGSSECPQGDSNPCYRLESLPGKHSGSSTEAPVLANSSACGGPPDPRLAPRSTESPPLGYPGVTRLPPPPRRRTLIALDAPPPKLLKVAEVAAQLGVSTASVYELCRAGVLAHSRVASSSSIRVAPADLDAFLSARRRGGR